MTHEEYWMEALADSLDGIGKSHIWEMLFTEDEKSQIGRDLEMSHDCIGQAFYSPPASDMVNYEIRELKEKIKSHDKECEEWRNAFIKNVCLRHRCSPQDVAIEKDGTATIK